MSYLGGATFDWASDYAQFYLVDSGDPRFEPPVDITPVMEKRRWHRMETGLLVYTVDSLRQIIQVQIFSAPRAPDPTECRSGKPWMQTELAQARFPTRRLTLSSPSQAGTEKYGPTFRLDAEEMAVRIQWLEWLEWPDDRYNVKRAEADVIRVDLWPA